MKRRGIATAAMAVWGLVAAVRRDRRRSTGEQVAVRLSGLTLRLLPVLPPHGTTSSVSAHPAPPTVGNGGLLDASSHVEGS